MSFTIRISDWEAHTSLQCDNRTAARASESKWGERDRHSKRTYSEECGMIHEPLSLDPSPTGEDQHLGSPRVNNHGEKATLTRGPRGANCSPAPWPR